MKRTGAVVFIKGGEHGAGRLNPQTPFLPPLDLLLSPPWSTQQEARERGSLLIESILLGSCDRVGLSVWSMKWDIPEQMVVSVSEKYKAGRGGGRKQGRD